MSGGAWTAVIVLGLCFLGLMCVGVYVWARTGGWIVTHKASKQAERDMGNLYERARYQIRRLSRDWQQSEDERP